MEERNRKKNKPGCSCPRVEHSQEEEKSSSWFLKSPKATNRNRSVFSIDITKKGLVIQKGDFDLSHLSESENEVAQLCLTLCDPTDCL